MEKLRMPAFMNHGNCGIGWRPVPRIEITDFMRPASIAPDVDRLQGTCPEVAKVEFRSEDLQIAEPGPDSIHARPSPGFGLWAWLNVWPQAMRIRHGAI